MIKLSLNILGIIWMKGLKINVVPAAVKDEDELVKLESDQVLEHGVDRVGSTVHSEEAILRLHPTAMAQKIG